MALIDLRARAWGRVEALRSQKYLNHPGHDQKSHGRKGSGGGQLRPPVFGEDHIAAGRGGALADDALTASRQYETEVGDLAGRRLYRGGGVGPHGDEALHRIAQEQGFDGKATKVTREQMDAAVAAGGTEMFRGVRDAKDGSRTAAEIHDQVATGEAHFGLGFSGNGYYMSSNEGIAASYGQTRRYAIHPDAKVVDYRALQTEQGGYLKTVAGTDAARVYSDPGRYAAARGYDAIRWRRGEEVGQPEGDEDEFMIVNRTAILVEEA